MVLATTALLTTDPRLRLACYELINVIDHALVIPLAFTTLIGSVVLGWLTPRGGSSATGGVPSKLVLTIVVVAVSTFGVGVWVENGTAVSPTATYLVVGASGNLAAFLLMTWLSVAKPGGRIRRPADRRGRATPPIARGAAPARS